MVEGVKIKKAVFFDWFNTLARYEPLREELHRRAFVESGLEISLAQVRRGVYLADKYWFEENSRSPLSLRIPEEQDELALIYQGIILNEAALHPSRDLAHRIAWRAQELLDGKKEFVLFDDVLPALSDLKARKLVTGMLTNATRNQIAVYRRLGLETLLDCVITSEEVGEEKPKPRIFLTALERTGLGASEVLYVGDQYNSDVLGARGVGIEAILLDRDDFSPEVTDCPRIRSLSEVTRYI